MIHADLHLDNVLFGPDGPVVLDWGSAAVGSPATDVFPFVATSLSPADQQACFPDVVERLGFDDELLDQGRRRLLCALAGVIGWRNRPPSDNPREQALRHAAIADGRLVHALRQWDVGRILG